MAEEDDLFYLQPGFDLQSLTVPRLRNILVAHNVPYPSSAKKGQLVELVESEILPKTKKLLRERDRVRRTSKGITDMSSQEGTIEGDEDPDRELMPPPPVPKTPRSRKSKSNLGDAATPSTSRRLKTPRTSKSSSKRRASDTETDRERLPPSARKSRKGIPDAVAAPAVRVEEPVRVKREDGASPFSDDNPFQSGSSPPSESRRVSSSSRNRKSQGRQSTSQRRETSSPIIKREDDQSSHTTYRIPVSQLHDEIPTTEEFTPDAARELQQDANGQLVPKRSQALVRRKKKPASKVAKSVPGVILTAVLGSITAWYRQEKINIGYCGVGHPTWSLSSNPNIPAWVHENLQPMCEPCPPHAICYPGMEVKCENDFVLQQHPLNLNGLVPIPPTCEPDSEKERRIKAVADKAIEELRERRAAYECGDELGKEEVKPSVKAGETKLEIPEETLKQEVSKMRRKGMSSDEFEELWRGALGDIMSRDEVEVVRDGSGRVSLSSSSLAKLPLTCALRRWTLRTLAAYRITVALLTSSALLLMYGRQRVVAYREATAQIPGLVATTLDRLATQAALKEDGRVSEGFIAAGQLRDDVLRNVFSVRERERVWHNVRKIVEDNSNVRAATREGGKTGEWSRVWEWIGPVDLAPGLEDRRSGLLRNSSEGHSAGREEMEVRKWDEGRPIY